MTPPQAAPDEPPTFAVVIPTYNRPEPLRACLASLTELVYPRDRFEVIVVDDGGQVQLDAVVAPFRTALSLRLIVQENGGPAAARNTGAAHTDATFIAFTDDDCAPAPDWLNAFAAAFRTAPGALLGGRITNALSENPYAAASQHLVGYLYAYYNTVPGSATFFTSNNMAVSATTFREMGGFDVTTLRATAEDRELCDRWKFLGHPLHYVPDAVVDHAHAMGLREFWRQHFNYGRGALYFHRVRKQRGQDTLTPEPLSFYADLVRYPLRRRTDVERPAAVAALMVVSQIANAAGFFFEAARSRGATSLQSA